LSAHVDYEVEYNNRARVPENPAIIAGWSRDAAAYRDARPPKPIAYGAGERNRIDLFSGDGAGPIVVFIHGGYWQALDGSFFSHLAVGLNAHGIDVAMPSYDLCPTVSIADIIDEMRTAMRELAKLGRPLVVSGQAWGESGLIGRPAILDMPVGRGHVVAFNFNPLHRDLNHGDHRLVWNAILQWQAIVAGPGAGSGGGGAR